MSIAQEMEAQPSATLTQSQKRSLDDAEPPVSTPKNSGALSDPESTPLTVLSSIASPSPSKRASSRAIPPTSSSNSAAVDTTASTQAAGPTSSSQQLAKRRKLTTQEKEDKKLEKEAKEKARAEKKAQKEADDKVKAEQRAQKEEEKRIKDEEKRRKNEEREEKKRAKELEQQQKEEEKRKKERSQMRLGAFFSKPKTESQSPAKTSVDANQRHTPEPSLLAPDVPMPDANSGPMSPQKARLQNARTDYERYFLPFQLPSHAILAPYNQYMEDPNKMAAARSRLDQLLTREDVAMGPITLDSFKENFNITGPRGVKTISIAQIIELVNGSSDQPIDLTEENTSSMQDPAQLLREIPMKYIHFPEDWRPPYYGTYTKPHTADEASKLARNPCSRNLRETDYDYDSEAEWEEGGEGEDLDSEGDEDLDEEGDDDMDGFLDDEDDPQVKRRLINGNQEPISTGLCWEDASGVSRLNDGSGAISTEFKHFKMGFLLEPQPQTIDPFSTAYWSPEPASTTVAVLGPSKTATIDGLMQPPRMPLTQRPVNGMMNILSSSQTASSGPQPKASKPPKRLIPNDQLAAFKVEVEGSDLTKLALIEALKKKFPKLPKDAISNTLSTVAARIGAREAEKRWVLL